MRRAWLAALAACAAAAPAPDKKVPAPAEAVAALASFAAPAGWKRVEYANGVDAVVAFENGEDRLTLKVFGAPGSFYKTPAEFLSGPAATTMGRKPERAGKAAVAGKRRRVWRHGFPLADGDPHTPYLGRQRLGRELFVILPPAKDGRFLVVAWERQTEVPELEPRAETAWKALLKSVRLPAAAK